VAGASNPLATLCLQIRQSSLINYLGYGELGATYIFKPKKLYADVTLRKGDTWDWKGSLQAQLYLKVFKADNQYLALQWYQGYGESLIDYHRNVSMVRIGLFLKPSELNFF
jgi:phospholipase A1